MKKYFLYTIGVVLVVNVIGVIVVLAVFTFNQLTNITYDFEKVDLEVVVTGQTNVERAQAGAPGINATAKIRNLSSTPVLLRVIPVEEWTSSNGTPLPSGNVTFRFDSSVSTSPGGLTAPGNVGMKWFRGTDGYFYYYEKLCPMEATTILVTGYTINSVANHTNATLNVNFLAEAVQAEGNVWSRFFNANNVPVVVVSNWNTGGIYTTLDLLTTPRTAKVCPDF